MAQPHANTFLMLHPGVSGVSEGVAMFFVVADGVNPCIHNCVENGYRKWIRLEYSSLLRKRYNFPQFGSDNTCEIGVPVRKSRDKFLWSMVMFQRKKEKIMVDTSKALSNHHTVRDLCFLLASSTSGSSLMCCSVHPGMPSTKAFSMVVLR